MNQFPECDQFTDHRRAICRGERPDLNCDVVNQYRQRWGLDPLANSLVSESRVTVVPAPDVPDLFQRVVTFAGALTEHLRDGMTRCAETEIQARLATCQTCPSFTGSHCRECGCACSSKQTFFNKLAWRSERCPLGRW